MNNPAAIGAAAGAVSALMFVSSGTILALLLAPIVPLPLVIAGLGWGIQAGIVGLVAGSLVSAAAGFGAIAQYFLTVGGPSALLIYLALLSRPDPQARAGQQALIWYPPGRLVAWTALMAGAVGAGLAVVVAVRAGIDYQAGVRQMIEQEFLPAMREATGQSLSGEQIERFVAMTTAFLPALSATLWFFIMLLNLWLGGRIALVSGRLIRPWPTLSDMEYPRFLAIGFLLALLGTLFTGLIFAMASAFTGAFLAAYLIMGLAVVHVITRGSSFRPIILVLLYVGIVLVGWLGLLVALLGIGEPVFKLRQRLADGRGKADPPDMPPRG